MKTKHSALLLFAPVVVAVSLACSTGCGGSGETSSTKPQSPAEKARSNSHPSAEKAPPPKRSPAEKARYIKEKARFVKRGNAICRRADAEQRRLAARYLKKGPVAYKWELAAPAVAPAMEKELRGLRALKPPEGDEAKVRRILEKMEKGVGDTKYDPIDLIYTESDPFRGMHALAKRYGLTVCAVSSQTVIRPRDGNFGF
jgi:hypothetical protein